jgi:hypothetical protein
MSFRVNTILVPTVSLGIFGERKSLMIILILCDSHKAIPVTNGKKFCPKIDKIVTVKNENVHCSVNTLVVAIFFRGILNNLIVTLRNY